MPTRRPHTKTRGGCSTCKARKVRCDEEKPVCRNCTRGSRPCRYPNQVLALPNALVGNSSTDVQDQIFPMRDMELLHFFTVYSYTTMTDNPDNYHIWQFTVPQMAFSFPFLLHGLLAVSALHRLHQSDEDKRPGLMTLARYHQQHALRLYIPLLQAIDQENCHALFAFSVVITVICYGMLHDNSDATEPLIPRFVDVFDALSGAAVVATEALDWLPQGPLGQIMDPLEPTNRDFEVLEPGMRDSLYSVLKVAERICEAGPDDKVVVDPETRRQAYTNAIYGLATVYSPGVYKHRVLGVVISWSLMAGTGYVALLRQRDPLAVVLLALYGVVLHRADSERRWIWQGLGRRLTKAASLELDSSWMPYIEWAQSRVADVPTPNHSVGKSER